MEQEKTKTIKQTEKQDADQANLRLNDKTFPELGWTDDLENYLKDLREYYRNLMLLD